MLEWRNLVGGFFKIYVLFEFFVQYVKFERINRIFKGRIYKSYVIKYDIMYIV